MMIISHTEETHNPAKQQCSFYVLNIYIFELKSQSFRFFKASFPYFYDCTRSKQVKEYNYNAILAIFIIFIKIWRIIGMLRKLICKLL